MNRALLVALVLVLLFLFMRQMKPVKNEPKCHYIYGCTNNLPDWGYWKSGDTFSL